MSILKTHVLINIFLFIFGPRKRIMDELKRDFESAEANIVSKKDYIESLYT